MTRHFSLILTVSLALTACSNQTDEKEQTETLFIPDSPSTTVQQPDTFIADSTPISTDKIKLACSCSTNSYGRAWINDIFFQSHSSQNKKNDELFSKWSNDTLRLKVTSIRFSYYDTIPDRFKIFENVEQVILGSIFDKDWKEGKSIYGLDMFPKLKTVTFWGSSIKLDPTAKWLRKIERLHVEKTSIRGLTDFSEMHNLRVLYMAYSGFKEFPKNIESLKCLSELTLGAYVFGNINLADIDISKLPCLQKLELQTWYNTLTGIPQGLEHSNLQTLKIHHQRLTDVEKEKIKTAR